MRCASVGTPLIHEANHPFIQIPSQLEMARLLLSVFTDDGQHAIGVGDFSRASRKSALWRSLAMLASVWRCF